MTTKSCFACLAFFLWLAPAMLSPAAAATERFDEIEHYFFSNVVSDVATLIARIAGA
jgi:hypothetical protein